MSILSSVKSAASKAKSIASKIISGAKNVISKVGGGISQSASALSSLSGAGTKVSTNNGVTTVSTPKGGTAIIPKTNQFTPANYTPRPIQTPRPGTAGAKAQSFYSGGATDNPNVNDILNQNPDNVDSGTLSMARTIANYSGAASDSNNIFSSSDSIRRDEQGTADTVDGLVKDQFLSDSGGSDSDARKAYKKSQSVVDDYIKELEQRSKDNESSINATYDALKKKTEGEQAGELGQASTQLARIGGYLGPSASSIGYMQNLNAQHKLAIADLEGKRLSALNDARNSISDKKFEAAKESARIVKELEAEIYKRNQDHLSNVMQIGRYNQEQTKFVADQADKKLDFFAESGQLPSVNDVIDLSVSLSNAYGSNISPEAVQGLLDAKIKTAKIKQLKDASGAQSELYTLLKKVPKGQYINIAGQLYEGMDTGDSGTTKSSAVKKEFIADVSAGMPKSEALKLYSDDISLDFINSYYQSTEGSNIQDRIDKGEVSTFKDTKGKEYYYDKAAYQNKLDEWDTGGTLFSNDTSIQFGGKTYKGPNKSKPSKADFIINRDIKK